MNAPAKAEFFDADSELPHDQEQAAEDAFYAEHERQERAKAARALTFVGLDNDWLAREMAMYGKWPLPNAAGQWIP